MSETGCKRVEYEKRMMRKGREVWKYWIKCCCCRVRLWLGAEHFSLPDLKQLWEWDPPGSSLGVKEKVNNTVKKRYLECQICSRATGFVWRSYFPLSTLFWAISSLVQKDEYIQLVLWFFLFPEILQDGLDWLAGGFWGDGAPIMLQIPS